MKEPDRTAVQMAYAGSTAPITAHIQQASRTTGISFSYLMAQAHKESAFQPEATSRGSSAAGLYQFTKTTWLDVMKRHGAAHGLGDLADKITIDESGTPTVADAKTRQEILDLRRDPKTSALMAGEYAKDNKEWLEQTLGRPVGATDLYLAHFLGPGGAAKLLKAKAADPSQPAAAVVPAAARSNPKVFYDGSHSPRSVASVYDKVHRAIDRPIRRFAQLESKAEAAAKAAQAKVAASTGTTATQGDATWPFERGEWPPPLEPEVRVRPDAVAYSAAADSADVISSPMPATEGSTVISAPMPPPLGDMTADATGDVQSKGAIGRILTSVRKSLFG